MAFSFAFFSDPALTTSIDYAVAIRQALGSAIPGDICVWFGSPDTTAICQDAAAPGVNPIMIGIVNATPGINTPESDIRLALSPASLASATPGAALALPHTVQGGAGNAIAVYVRVSNSLTTAGQRDNLSFITQNLIETTS